MLTGQNAHCTQCIVTMHCYQRNVMRLFWQRKDLRHLIVPAGLLPGLAAAQKAGGTEGSCNHHPEALALGQAAARLQVARRLHRSGAELCAQASLRYSAQCPSCAQHTH